MRLSLRNNASTCNREHLAWGINQLLSRGDPDNHDIPQSMYAQNCRLQLCFERLASDMDHLVAQSARFRSRHGRSVLSHSPTHNFSSLPTIRPWTNLRCGSGTLTCRCEAHHLLDVTIAKLRVRYAADVQLHRRVCDASAISLSPSPL